MRKLLVAALAVVAAFVTVGALGFGASGSGGSVKRVKVPHADRFTPYGLTVHVGDRVKWRNTDADDHTVVADRAFDTAGHKSTNSRLKANGGTFSLRFRHPGTFVYYCRFHAHLDRHNQPVAPGPDGGIANKNGNFGTPMSGVITVLPRKG